MRRTAVLVPLTVASVVLAACGGGGGADTASGGGGGVGSSLVLRVATVTGAKPDAAVGDTSTYLADGSLPALRTLANPLLPTVYRFVFDGTGLATLGASAHDQQQLQTVDATHLSFSETDPVFDAGGTRTGDNTFGGTVTADSVVAPGHLGFYEVTVTAVPHEGGTGIAVGDKGSLVIGPSGYANLADLDIGVTDDALWLSRVGATWYAQTSAWSDGDGRVDSESLTLDDGVTTGSYRTFHGATTDAEIAFSIAAKAVPDAGGHRHGVLAAGTAPGYTGTAYVAARYPTAGASLLASFDAGAMTVTISGGAAMETFAVQSWSFDGGTGVYDVAGIRGYVDDALTTAHHEVVEEVALEFTAAGHIQGGTIAYGLAFDPTPDHDEPNDTSLGGVTIIP